VKRGGGRVHSARRERDLHFAWDAVSSASRINPRASCARPVGIYGGDARRQNANPTTICAMRNNRKDSKSLSHQRSECAHPLLDVFIVRQMSARMHAAANLHVLYYSLLCVCCTVCILYAARGNLYTICACVLILQQSAPTVFPLGIACYAVDARRNWICTSCTRTARFDEVAKGQRCNSNHSILIAGA
jgi:hypothetical protein